MRSLIILLTTVLTLGVCQAQDIPTQLSKGLYRTFYLPDGTALNGRVIERLTGDTIAIETSKGAVYRLSRKESQRIKRAFERTPMTSVDPSRIIPLPLNQEPNFLKGSSQFSADLMTHFSSGGSEEASDPESGIVASLSYLYGVAPQLKVGGGLGIMTVRSGSKERVFPLFARAEYQIRPKISATLNAGYGLIPTSDIVLNAKNGIFGNATVAFDLVGPESAYTSRIGFGIVTQYLDLGRTELIRESNFGTPVVYSQYVERVGWMRRLQITFTHAWRLSPSKSLRKKKS